MKFLKELKPYIIIAVVVILIRTFIITPGIVSGGSMEPSLYDKELVLINKIGLNFGIDRFNIVVIKYGDSTIIKRVIGLPGETVEYRDDKLYINDVETIAPFDFEYTSDFILSANEGEYIVLGDNRNISKDSRSFGPVSVKDIVGKVRIRLFPFSKIGVVK